MLSQATIQESRERNPKQTRPTARHHVVIVVGGFGGVEAAKRLAGAVVDITLVDQRNHHLFQRLLYQVATVVGEGPTGVELAGSIEKFLAPKQLKVDEGEARGFGENAIKK